MRKILFLFLLLITHSLAMGQPEGATKLYENSAKLFPLNLNALKAVGHMTGGSGGVTILEDPLGVKYTLKCATNDTQLKEEILADALYRAMGVLVPGFAVYTKVPLQINAYQTSSLVRLSRFIESNPQVSDQAKAQALAQNFVADAFMGNWDIVVDNFKNVVMDKGGKLWRIDNGGSLRYRALGEHKRSVPGWEAGTVNDLDYLRDPAKNSAGARVYGQLTQEQLQTQAQRVLSKAPQVMQTFEQVARAIGLENPEEVRAMLSERFHDLTRRFEAGPQGQVQIQGQPTPSTYLAATHQKPHAQSSAGILVYSVDPQTKEPMVLLGQRIRHRWWGSLGGKSDVDPSQGPIDQTLMATAIRETREESQDKLIFSPQRLQESPSHDLINRDGSLYRMYIAPTAYLYPQNIPLTGSHAQEYTAFKWIKLADLMQALQPGSPRLMEERQETVQVGDVILHAPLYRMFMEPAVHNILRQILQNPLAKLPALRTKTGYLNQKVAWAPVDTSKSLEKAPFGFNAAGELAGKRSLKGVPGSEETAPFNPKQHEREVARTIANKAQVSGELKQAFKDFQQSRESQDNFDENSPSHEPVSDASKMAKMELAARPYTASDAYLKIMMTTDYILNIDLPKQLISIFFDHPYTKFGKLEVFENQDFQSALAQALQEERKHREWYVFYHGTDAKMAFLYDILSTYRARFKAVHAQSSPAFRFLDGPFWGLDNVDEFKAFFTKEGRISNYEKNYPNPEFKDGTLAPKTYQDMGLSVNISLFGSDDVKGSSSIQFFGTGTTNTPPDYKTLFDVVQREIGFDKTWEEFQPLFEEYQRNMGRLYQIFVAPEYLDQIGYLSHGGGNPLMIKTSENTETDKLVYSLNLLRSSPEDFAGKVSSLKSVQGRLFLKPEIFSNPKAVQIKVYENRALDPKMIDTYHKKLNALVSEDVASWVLKHEGLSKGAIHGEKQPIERLTQEVHRGEMGTAYQTSDKMLKKINHFKELLDEGDVASIQVFLDQNPDYPLNAPIEHIDYYNPRNNFSLPPLWYIFEKIQNNKTGLLKFLIEREASLTIKNEGETLLGESVRIHNLDLINFLLDQKGVDVNQQDELGDTPLHIATRMGNLPLIQLLTDRGARLDIKNKRGETLLHLALKANLEDFTRFLLNSNKIDINAQDILGNTALYYAAIGTQKNPQIIQDLLDHEAQVQVINKQGDTPLSITAKEGNLEFIQTVLVFMNQHQSLSPQTIIGSLGSVTFDFRKHSLQEIIRFLQVSDVAVAIREATFSSGSIQDILEICGQLSNLRSLTIKNNMIGAVGAQAIVSSPISRVLTSLNLAENNIGSAGAKDIATLRNLQSLNISTNEIGAAGAKDIATLRNLQSLNITGNNIGSAGAKNIATLRNLQFLNISRNNIGAAGAKDIATLTGLHTLDLSYSGIGEAGAKDIATLTGLHTLDLSYSGIGEAGAKDIATLKNLQSLNITGDYIGSAGAKDIATLKNLQSLNITDNYIGDAGAKDIATLKNLQSLDLSHNIIGAAGAKDIATLTGLHTLNLSSNKIGAAGAKDIATLTGLHTLNLASNGIGAAGAKDIATLTGLHTLDLSHNSIGDAGAKDIATLTGLHTLDLSYNGIGATSAKEIATLKNLQSLNLDASKIGDVGAKDIATLKNLQSLNLDSSNIGETGAKDIATLTGLHTLNLSRNKIGDVGAKDIATLKNLQSLDLSASNIGDAGAKNIATLKNLHTLNLHYNNIGDTVKQLLKQQFPFAGL